MKPNYSASGETSLPVRLRDWANELREIDANFMERSVYSHDRLLCVAEELDEVEAVAGALNQPMTNAALTPYKGQVVLFPKSNQYVDAVVYLASEVDAYLKETNQ